MSAEILLVLLGVIGAQGVIILVQWVFFMRQTQKLVDKLMSRSYTEYTRAQEPIPKPQFIAKDDLAEDLGVLNEFQL